MKQSETVGNSRKQSGQTLLSANSLCINRNIWTNCLKIRQNLQIKKETTNQHESVGNIWVWIFWRQNFLCFYTLLATNQLIKRINHTNVAARKSTPNCFQLIHVDLLFLFLFCRFCRIFRQFVHIREFAERRVCPDCFRLFPTVSRWIIFIFWGCCAFRDFLFLFVDRCFCLTVSEFDLIIPTLFRTVLSWPQRSGLAIFQVDFWSYFGHKALFLYYSKHGALGTTQQSSNFAWTLNSLKTPKTRSSWNLMCKRCLV